MTGKAKTTGKKSVASTNGKRKKCGGKASKWRDEYYVRIYQMLRDGMSVTAASKALGVSPEAVYYWMEQKPALKAAVEEGSKAPGQRDSGYRAFRDFVHGKLPPEARELWDRLESIDASPEAMADRDECLDIISAKPKITKQHLLLHSLLHSNFQMSQACQKVGIACGDVREWMREDPDFRSLVHGIHEYKKDFFESALINLVRAGDSAATIFAARTMLRDRGYNDKVQIEVKSELNVRHTLNLDELPLEVQRAALEAVRRKRLALEDRTQDGEVVE